MPTADPGVLMLRREWGSLRAPRLDDLTGDLAAQFVRPLRRVAPAGLGLVGLPRWYGKRFTRRGDVLGGTNLVRSGPGLRQVLPMTAAPGRSLLDGRPAVVVSYAPDARRPWRWVRDELRERPDGVVVGMTVLDVPVLRRLGGAPFLLRRVPPAGRAGCARPHLRSSDDIRAG